MRLNLGLLLTTAVLSIILSAQTSNSGPHIFTSSISYHVPDETRTSYEDWLKTKYRRFSEGMMKENPNLRYVIATRVIFGGIQEPEANAFLTYGFEGFPKRNGPLLDKVAKELFDKSYENFLAEARPWRRRLGQTLSARVVGTPMNVSEGDVLRLDFKRITPGRMQDYIQLERDYLRLREAQVKAGAMKGWSMSTLVLPGGSEHDFDAYTVHTGKDLEQVMTWGRGTAEIAAKLDPPFNSTGLAMRGNEVQKIIRGEARLVVMVVQRP